MTVGRSDRRTGGLTLLTFLVYLGVGAPAWGQASVAERLRGRVPAEVAPALERLVGGAAAQGLPIEPLVQKAIEGGAKQVPGPVILQAVRALLTRLEGAAGALRGAGVADPSPAAIEAGAFALNAGLTAADLTAIARANPPLHALDATLRVAATLTAMGVPAAQTVELVIQVLQAGRPPSEVLGLPAQVQAGIARGFTPAQAAAGLARAAQARGQGPARPVTPPRRPRPERPPSAPMPPE